MNYIIYKIVKGVGKPLFRFLYRPEYIGKENIPTNGSCILAGNHKSLLDALIMVSGPDRVIHMLAKKELFKTKFTNMFFRSMGCVSVDRSIHDENAKSEAINLLNDGEMIGLFPEGTRNLTDKIILPFKYGAVSFAKKTNSPIVPFVIVGDYKLFRKSIKIVYGKPYNINNDLEIENKKLENIIIKMLKKEGTNEKK